MTRTRTIDRPEELSEINDLQDSAISIDMNMNGERLDENTALILSMRAQEKNMKSMILKNIFMSSQSLCSVMSAVLWKSEADCLVIRNCNLDAKILSSCLDATYTSNTHTSEKQEKENNLQNDSKKNIEKNVKNNNKKITINTDNSNITLLDISFNNLNSLGIKHFLSILKRCPNLKILALDGNDFNINDIQNLMNIVQKHPSITQISLSNCGLTDECIEYINYGLKINR